MTFEEALKALKKGKAIKRKGVSKIAYADFLYVN